MKSGRISKKVVCRLLAAGLMALGGAVSAARAQDADQPKGKLKIEGTHIARLLLERDDGHTEEWSNLRGTIELPVGTYRVKQLTLRDDYTCQAQGLTKLRHLEVAPDKTAVLKAGGPLQQTIQIKRQGRVLVLNYQLRGIGGEEYAAPRRADNRATFTVYRGDRAIANDDFEYG
ncbi:MAG: hypothetical protein JW993_19450 [Sedimentisphaerales bacterium]|nr:hypothetical protein [Sedimentisphaerales bacterium]